MMVARRFGGGPPARDDNGWILSLKRGDTLHVLVDPKRPQRSHVLRLWKSSASYGG
jgi:hypothetical protein